MVVTGMETTDTDNMWTKEAMEEAQLKDNDIGPV
jgi:hypothetical protein